MEFRRSPLKTFGLLLAGLALVTGSWFVTRIGEDAFTRGVAWFGIVFFGIATVKAGVELFSTRILYVIDDRGIEDRRARVFIPWSDVRSSQVVSISGTRFLTIELDRAEEYAAKLPWYGRGMSKINRDSGFGDWNLAFTGVTPGIEAAEKLVAAAIRP